MFTLFAFIVAIAISTGLFTVPTQLIAPISLIVGAAIFISTLLLLRTFFTTAVTIERKSHPRFAKTVNNHKLFSLGFPAIFIIVFLLLCLSYLPTPITPSLSILLTGIAFDLALCQWRVFFRLADPFYYLSVLLDEAKQQFSTDQTHTTVEWVDAIAETGMKAVESSSYSLCRQSLKTLGQFTDSYLKAQLQFVQDHEEKEPRINFIILSILQRLEQIYRDAASYEAESILNELTFTMGKISYSVARTFPSFMALPIRQLGKLTQEAQVNGLNDLGIKGTLTLQELGRTLTESDPNHHLPLKDFYALIIKELEEIAQLTFKLDKSTSIPYLMEPFNLIKADFAGSEHPDAAGIIAEADRALVGFETLNSILQTMPKAPQQEQKAPIEE